MNESHAHTGDFLTLFFIIVSVFLFFLVALLLTIDDAQEDVTELREAFCAEQQDYKECMDGWD